MKLILLRHGHDLATPDGESTLSRQGRDQVAATAAALHAIGYSNIDLLLCSPSNRALETARELSSTLPVSQHEVSEHLAPGAGADKLDTLLRTYPFHGSLVFAVVGHEPQLSDCVLRWGGLPENDPESGRPMWIMKRGAAIVVDIFDDDSTLRIHDLPTDGRGSTIALPSAVPRSQAGVF